MIELNNDKIEVLTMKLQIAKLELEKSEFIKNQEYHKATLYRDEQRSLYDQLNKIELKWMNLFNSMEFTHENYPLMQQIQNLLLEFKYENIDFKTEAQQKLNTQLEKLRSDYDSLDNQWREFQKKGDFKTAKEIEFEKSRIGKTIEEISSRN